MHHNAPLGLSAALHRTIRRALAGIFVLGSAGLIAELLLIGHVADPWQQAPLVLIALSLVALGWQALRPSAASQRLLQAAMLLLVLGGAAGVVLHYRSNVEFEMEMYPSLSGLQLFCEAMTGAIPALAPGALVQLGLLGLVYSYLGGPQGTLLQTQEKMT